MDFDEYRRRYDELTDDEHRAAYAAWHAAYPDQRHCTIPALSRFIAERPDLPVVEVGGWDGWAASQMLEWYPSLPSWRNYEACAEAVTATVCADPRYTPVAAPFRWWREWCQSNPQPGPFVVVASHVVEHMSSDDLGHMLAHLCAYGGPEAWYIEAPLSEQGQDWSEYAGSHVLTEGWRTIEEWLSHLGTLHGYRRTWTDGDARAYVRA